MDSRRKESERCRAQASSGERRSASRTTISSSEPCGMSSGSMNMERFALLASLFVRSPNEVEICGECDRENRSQGLLKPSQQPGSSCRGNMGNVLAMPAHVFQTAQQNHVVVVAEETFRLCDVDRLSQVTRKLHRSIEQHPHSKQADTTCCVSAERRSHDSYPSSDDGDVPEWHLHFSNRANPLPLTDKRQLHYRSHMYMETEGLECILPDHMAQLEDIVRHHTVAVGPGYEEELLQHLPHSTDALTSLFNELEIRLTSISPECEDFPIRLKTYTELLCLIKGQLYDESRPFREFKIGYFAQFAKHPIEILVKIALLLSKMEWSVTDICPMMLAYEAVMDVVPLIQKLIPSESDDLLPEIKSNIWESFRKIVGSMGDPQGGAIHSVTCSLVDSVKIIHSHKQLVQSFAPDDDSHSFGNLLSGVIGRWISALEKHPMSDSRRKNIFMLNNMSHLKGKTNVLLDDLLPLQHLDFPYPDYFKLLTDIWIQGYLINGARFIRGKGSRQVLFVFWWPFLPSWPPPCSAAILVCCAGSWRRLHGGASRQACCSGSAGRFCRGIAWSRSFDEDEDVEMALRTPLASADAPAPCADELTHRPHYVSWASASYEDDDRDDNEEMAPRLRRLPSTPKSQLRREVPFDAPAIWRTVSLRVSAATPDVHSARWHALSCRASASSIIKRQLPIKFFVCRAPMSTTAEGDTITTIVTPVLQIMPELQQQPEASESIVSVVSVADDVEAVGMLAPDPLVPSLPLAFVDRGDSNIAVTDSHVAMRKMVSLRDKVDEVLF
ncbi:unnamed protein product [Triticum turgidum subsp. durum]|uniref:Exocyst subunit Exo70 family protein n=1 Tax=Triticum turgidum subsp. durum TaxID=4567 RepID=A0A9R1NGX6_TRITD|nr:unnamed protein product [Triticum turgidum subsp. durum]